MTPMRIALTLFVATALGADGRADEPTIVPNKLTLETRMPVSRVSANQSLAEQIAQHVETSGQLRHYHMDVICQNGHVLLQGEVSDAQQHVQALQLVREIPGVLTVHDELVVRNAAAVQRAQAQKAAPIPPGPLLFPQSPNPAPPDLTQKPPEPTPIYAAPHAHPHMFQAPRMPPNAWPTYAPYNNYSRVAYPEKYPHKSWPFIGPVYPFPKVPLGWRSVTLQWEDGFWWMRRNPTGHDWWRIRYW